MTKQETRHEYWDRILKKYPFLNIIKIDGYQGYGYLTWESLEKIGVGLKVKKQRVIK